MAKQIWAIDLGDWSLKVVRGTCVRKTGAVIVDLFDEIVYGTLPCGFDAGPMERQREGLIAFHKKYEIEHGDDLALCISGSEVFCRFINLPPVPESIADIIRYEARQQIPFDIEDVVWDYQPVQDEYELGEEIEVALFALKKDRLNELMDMLGEWRRNLRIIQNAPLALYNFLYYEGRTEEPVILLDVGSVTADLLVLNPPRFWLRTLLTAGGDLTRSLMQRFKIGAAEAERLKRRLGSSEHKNRILKLFRPIVDDITNEVQRSLGYYKSLARDVRFDKMLAVGSAMRLEGLSEMVGKGLQYEVMQLDSLKRMELAEGVDRAAFLEALPGLGSALGMLVQGAGEGRMHVNMVPDEVSFANALNRKKPWLLAASVCVLLAVVVLLCGEMILKSPLNSSLDETNTAFDGGSVLELVEEYDSLYKKREKAHKEQVDRIKRSGRLGVPETVIYEVLPALLDALPERVYFRSVRVEWHDSVTIDGDKWQTASKSTGRDEAPDPDNDEEDNDEDAPEETRPGGPVAGDNSKLYVFFVAETPKYEPGYVEKEVLKRFEAAKFHEDSALRLFGKTGDVPLFAKGALDKNLWPEGRVLLGKYKMETVAAEDGEPRDGDTAASSNPVRVFSGMAVFNLQGDTDVESVVTETD